MDEDDPTTAPEGSHDDDFDENGAHLERNQFPWPPADAANFRPDQGLGLHINGTTCMRFCEQWACCEVSQYITNQEYGLFWRHTLHCKHRFSDGGIYYRAPGRDPLHPLAYLPENGRAYWIYQLRETDNCHGNNPATAPRLLTNLTKCWFCSYNDAFQQLITPGTANSSHFTEHIRAWIAAFWSEEGLYREEPSNWYDLVDEEFKERHYWALVWFLWVVRTVRSMA